MTENNTNEIEITPEMIEAGAQVLREAFEGSAYSFPREARNVFLAMISVQSAPPAE